MKIVFTGLVEALGRVIEVQSRPPGMRLVVDAGEVASDAVLGDSISVNGCCLTVVEIDGNKLAFDAGDETLKRTNLGRLGEADVVNLERSLQVGDRLGGHYVTGHIDGLGSLQQRNDDGEWSTCWFQVPPALTRQMASKGSVA
ncbi:MAG: riboflavin synthase, partial [bacterium]|nr:riboflavin synthase [bacterium]